MTLQNYITSIITQIKQIQEITKQPIEISFNLKTRPSRTLNADRGYATEWFIEVGDSIESFPNIISFTVVSPYKQ